MFLTVFLLAINCIMINGNFVRTADAHPIAINFLPYRIEQCVIQGAIATDVGPAAAQFKIARQTDAGLLNAARTTGDGDLIGRQRRVVAHKGVLDQGRGQGDGPVQIAQHGGAGDAAVGLS